MTVRELMEILETMDEDAMVYVMSQEGWPFECKLHGVAVREEFVELDEDGPQADCRGAMLASDVFLVEGEQLRYGDKAAWDAARRR